VTLRQFPVILHPKRPWLIRATVGLASGMVLAVVMYSCASLDALQPVAPPVVPVAPAVLAQPVQPTAVSTPISHIAKASWYGPGLVGKKTTSGEPYNPNALTAASKTLPLGSVVKVTNPENGKSVKVRINDRGPFVPGRSLDLSKRAAEKIGIVHRGVAQVKVSKAPATSPPAAIMPDPATATSLPVPARPDPAMATSAPVQAFGTPADAP
jgi:rare lipoprotein A